MLNRPHPLLQEFGEQLAKRGYDQEMVAREIRQVAPHANLSAARGARGGRRSRSGLPPRGGIRTLSGRYVDLAAPDPAQVHLDDIAHALGAICRFTGQTSAFYSVAQHSLMVASLVPHELRLRALLHDATEAYLQDLPTPVKALLPGYADLEVRVWGAIAAHFGLEAIDRLADPIIKQADRVALRIEMRDLFPAGYPEMVDLPPPPAGLAITEAMTPVQARESFLAAVLAAAA